MNFNWLCSLPRSVQPGIVKSVLKDLNEQIHKTILHVDEYNAALVKDMETEKPYYNSDAMYDFCIRQDVLDPQYVLIVNNFSCTTVSKPL